MDNITLGQFKHIIIDFASILTASGIICGVALKVGKRVLKDNLKPFNDRIDELEESRVKQHEETKDEIQKIKDELKRNSLNTLKNTICNAEIPLSERVAAGEEYISKNGNGAVKVRYHQLKKRYEQELKRGDR